MHIILLITVIFGLNLKISAQKAKMKTYQKYLDAKTLYVFNSEANTKKYTCDTGDEISFYELVKKAWHDKKIELISEEEYLNQNDVADNFHLTIFARTIAVENNSTGTNSTITSVQHGIIIKQGKTELGEGRPITLLWLDYKGIQENILPERLEHGVNGLRLLLDNYKDEIHRSGGIHRVSGYENDLASHTLLVKRSLLHKSLFDIDKLKSVYSYPIEIVSDEQWSEAIKSKKEGCLYIDHAQGGRFSSANIYTTKGGRLIITSYPWTGHKFQLDKKFFKDTFSGN